MLFSKNAKYEDFLNFFDETIPINCLCKPFADLYYPQIIRCNCYLNKINKKNCS